MSFYPAVELAILDDKAEHDPDALTALKGKCGETFTGAVQICPQADTRVAMAAETGWP